MYTYLASSYNFEIQHRSLPIIASIKFLVIDTWDSVVHTSVLEYKVKAVNLYFTECVYIIAHLHIACLNSL